MPTSSPSRFQPVRSGAPAGSPARLLMLFAGVAAALVTVVGIWAGQAVRDGVREDIRQELETLLRADVTALELWIESEQRQVQTWADDPRVQGPTAALVEAIRSEAVTDAEGMETHPSGAAIRDALAKVVEFDHALGYVVFNRDGRWIAAMQEENLDRQVTPDGSRALFRIFEGDTVFVPPFLDESGSLRTAFAAPVRKVAGDPGSEVIGALAFMVDADREFSRILSVASFGDYGQTYAFDGQGMLLSACRTDDRDLRRLGLLAEGVPSLLNLRLCDPGFPVAAQPDREMPSRSALPLTHAVAMAVGEGAGSDVAGYRDYLGRTVFGAWTWLGEQEIGVVTEIAEAEAYGALQPMRSAFVALIVILATVALVVLLQSYLVLRMRARVDVGQQVGQYTLLHKIGEGGMGRVYHARHSMMQRPCAVKLLRADHSDTDILRFEQEVQSTAELSHPNTVMIYDYGRTPAGLFYYAMEYLRGVPLNRLIEIEGRIGAARAVHILRQMALSLQEAHGAGLLHRDIKPQNVFLCRRGGQDDQVKVLDFGLVKEIGQEEGLTSANIVSGTVGYVAPERLTDPRNQGPHTDVYSLGVVGYNLVAGCHIFDFERAGELSTLAMTQDPDPPSRRGAEGIPYLLDQLLHRCVARDPVMRPQNAREVLEALAEVPLAEPWGDAEASAWWQAHSELLVDPWESGGERPAAGRGA